jgi:hypothetical protein
MPVTIGDKLSAASADLAYLQKDKESPMKYSYVSEAAVKAAVNPVLVKHGLFIAGTTYELLQFSFGENAKNQNVCMCLVRATVIIGDTDTNSVVSYQGLGIAVDKGDIKTVMKAEAAALKYALTSAFLISTGDDPEADQVDDEPAPRTNGKTAPKSDEPSAAFRDAMKWISTAPDVGALDLALDKLKQLKNEGKLTDMEVSEVRVAFSKRKTDLLGGKK